MKKYGALEGAEPASQSSHKDGFDGSVAPRQKRFAILNEEEVLGHEETRIVHRHWSGSGCLLCGDGVFSRLIFNAGTAEFQLTSRNDGLPVQASIVMRLAYADEIASST